MSALEKYFGMWVKQTYLDTERYYEIDRRAHDGKRHKVDCKLIEVTGTPYETTVYRGYCETCEYTVTGLRFDGTCSCGHETEWELEDVLLASLMNDLLEIKDDDAS